MDKDIREQILFICITLAIIASCQIVQTYRYIVTPAEAGRAMPVVIEEISSRVSNGSRTLPVEVVKPTKRGPYGY